MADPPSAFALFDIDCYSQGIIEEGIIEPLPTQIMALAGRRAKGLLPGRGRDRCGRTVAVCYVGGCARSLAEIHYRYPLQ
jgi:hypothetical protein